jgi:predicted small metal-binding protein
MTPRLTIPSVRAASSAAGGRRRVLPYKEVIMARTYIDCREFPSDMHCTVAIAADSEKELLDAAVQHAVAVHGHSDTPEFRQQLSQLFKAGTPPVEMHATA